MKIAAIHSYLNQKRGAELAFLNMVIGLKKKGHEIDVYVLELSSEFSELLKKNSIHFYTANFDKRRLKHLKKFDQIRKIYPIFPMYYLIKKINTKKYDIAFVHHSQTSLIIPFLKMKVIYYCQEPLRIFYDPSFQIEGINRHRTLLFKFLMIPYKYLDYIAVKKANLVLANSEFSRDTISKSYRISPLTTYLGVDTNKFKKLPILKENFVLSIGTIHPLKGHEFIIDSLAKILESKRPEIIIVGSVVGASMQKYMDQIIKIAKNNNIQLKIYEEIEVQFLISLYNRAKITLIGAIMEPFGLTAIESMACETPVIAIREGGLRESITNETGILVERDETKFAEAIEYLLDNPDIAEKMGKAGRKRVESLFTWEKCAENLEKNLRSVL